MDPIHLSSDVDFDEFIREGGSTEIVDSKSYLGGEWMDKTRQRAFEPPISKYVVPIDLSNVRFLVVTDVDPGSTVQNHRHSESILRYVVSGSFAV